MNTCEDIVMDDDERLDVEELMDLDDASEGEDEDENEDNSNLPISPENPDQLLSSSSLSNNHCINFHSESLSNSIQDAFSLTSEEVFPDPLQYQKFPLPGGKPLHIRRGPGRPRKERPPGMPRSPIVRRGLARGISRGKGIGYGRGIPRRTKSKDDDTHSESPSPLRIGDDLSVDGESSGFEKTMPAPEEPPYFPEQWPGKVCALCNLGERSMLGQGELLRLIVPEDFTPVKNINRDEASENLNDLSLGGDKSPRASSGLGAVTCRRQKSLAKCRNPSLTNSLEPVEELTIVGYLEEPEVAILFESNYLYVHKNCAIWSSGDLDLSTESVCTAVLQSSIRKCSYCSHFGAGISCKLHSCNRFIHFPCAAASSSFQDSKTLSLFCNQHLGQVPLLLNGDISCEKCFGMGDVSNLVMCSTCGKHFHGSCLGLALLPSVRSGWHCASCRLCQVCHEPEDLTKFMACERCDKVYHPTCLRPAVTSIPKYGWKCKCCRVCTDCGSRTPGAGLSSRWHSHYTICDSCYQQRNKGFSCPLCKKAYRAAAYREMVQCSACKKFVHATCDPEADPITYQQKKEAKSDYEYVCLHCKNVAFNKRKDSIEDYGGDSSLTASQESLCGDDSSEVDFPGGSEDVMYSIGLGKGKPFYASKIAKKKLGLSGNLVGRPKGSGKLGYQKRQKMTEFGRKRGPKAKMRGIFGVPGLGLQRPISDSSSKDEEPGVENRLVLCSSKDKFVLSQDICVMCGAIGTDQEGCLMACSQCGQCYHPYCANVKVTKVILQKGWRCLDCTVCEGCGERNDEGRLILCDDCDISYHIYCMDPPLEYVPQGTWKCKWCAQCQTCGANDPGFNSSWQKNYTQCGPCASHNSCAACNESYNEGDLIIQCVQCERWLHCLCDSIKTETDAEKCAEEGYYCILCRPRDVPPPHILCNLPKQQSQQQLLQQQLQLQQQQQQQLLQQQQIINKFPQSSSPVLESRFAGTSPELLYKPVTTPQNYLMDGVYLSESGMKQIKSLMTEIQITRKKRRKLAPVVDKDADIMATIESVVAGGSLDNSLEENSNNKLDLLDMKDSERAEIYKEGMVWAEQQPPPDGFSIYTTENGITVLRRKRQRNLQKLGIGGFVVRLRNTRKDKDDEGELEISSGISDDKPQQRRKPQRRKPKTKLSECFPQYMQEAFFGRDLMDTTKDKDLESSSDSDSEKNTCSNVDTIQLSQDEIKAIEQLRIKKEQELQQRIQPSNNPVVNTNIIESQTAIKREDIVKEEGSDTEALSDILPISSDLIDNDLVNTIMNEPDDDLAKASNVLEKMDEGHSSNKVELTDILSPHFNLESMVRDTGLPNMDSKDVEEIFKGVLTDESQESQESSVYQTQQPTTHVTNTPLISTAPHPANIQHANIQLIRPQVPTAMPTVGQTNLNSPMSFPPPSPYHSEYSNSPQFSPAFSEPPSPWVNPEDENSTPTTVANIPYNQRSNMKMEADEVLGHGATISSVLYANINHAEWKNEFPSWPERCKQILKKWRALPTDKKAPYLTRARDNRAALRMKKVQQIPKEISSSTSTTTTTTTTAAIISPVVTPTIASTLVPHNIKPTVINTIMTSNHHQISPSPVVVMATSSQKPTIGLLCSVATTSTINVQDKTTTTSSIAATTTNSSSLGLQLAEESEKVNNRERSHREAEQERQWKHLQAVRQQQAQMQQQVLQDQRIHTRVHRQISDDGSQTLISDNQSVLSAQLQNPVIQDGNPMVSVPTPSPNSQRNQFAAPAAKVNRGVIAPQSPLHQGIPPRLPGQPCAAAARPMGPNNIVRPAGIPNNFPQPPVSSPFSPQAPQSPHDFPQSPASSASTSSNQSQQQAIGQFQTFESKPDFQRNQSSYSVASPRNDVYAQPPGTPRPVFNPPPPRTSPHVYAPTVVSTPRNPNDLFGIQSNTNNAVQNYNIPPRPESRVDTQQNEVFNQQPEVNRQLRDLLQRQNFNKDVKSVNQMWSQENQNTVESTQQQYEVNSVQLQHTSSQQLTNPPAEGTFRQPLPPGSIRPRMPLQNALIRGVAARPTLIPNVDTTRMQGLDQRARMLLQRPPVSVTLPQQQFQSNQIMQQRMAGPKNQIPDQFDVMQRFQEANQSQNIVQRIVRTSQAMNPGIRMIHNAVRSPTIVTSVNESNVSMSETSEIPDNVTAELEKLEQEGAPMVEVENVSAILGDLGDDDDELLAEMGADFNILEYADPELDSLTGGEKTNILDLDLEQEEVETKDEKQKKDLSKQEEKSISLNTTADPSVDSITCSIQQSTETSNVLTQVSNISPQINQQITHQQTPQPQTSSIIQQQQARAAIVQQMHQHVQREAAMGRPVPPGTQLLSDDGAVGVVTSTNSVTVSYPTNFSNHQQQRLPVPGNQQIGMRMPVGIQNIPGRVVSVRHMIGARMPLGPPPPPPPYPGHPPPYPGAMQEQPLLLEELLEQEKREQEKQQQQQQVDTAANANTLLSDIEFERLQTDVLNSGQLTSSTPVMPLGRSVPIRQPGAAINNWQPVDTPKIPSQRTMTTQSVAESRIPTFNIPQLPAPPVPPENIVTEQDRHIHIQYDQWLNHQNQILMQQQKYYETEVQKLRKVRKSLNSKQRQCRKVGNELPENDAAELQRISTEQSILQKHLDSSRKQCRQHGMLLQEFRNKQQQKQAQQQASDPCSPLRSPSQHSSPMHSPAAVMSRSPGPGSVPSSIIQHSPVTSLVQNSPNPPLLQHSPGSAQQTNPGTMSPHNINMQQASPRIGTPQSQVGEESPFSPGTMPSPGVSRITSPQHRVVATGRLTTSPGSFVSQDGQSVRIPQQMMNDQVRMFTLQQQRFVRPGIIGDNVQRPRMQMQGIIYSQRSPLGSPQPNQQQILTAQQHQQLLQRQQQMMHQQADINMSQDNQNLINQRNLQISQRQQLLQQQQHQQQQQLQQQQIMQKPPSSPMLLQPASSPSPQLHQQQMQQQNFNNNQTPNSPLSRSPMMTQQATMGSPMLQQQLSQTSQPPSPMNNTRVQNHPPNSPMISQQYQPPSPMARSIPSTSPMLHQMNTTVHHPSPCQTPNSPMPPRSPMIGGSPLQVQRRQSTGNSPAMPERPQSVENPGTPRTPIMSHPSIHNNYATQSSMNESQQHMQLQQQFQHQVQQQTEQQQQNIHLEQMVNRPGGGNPHNPNNPIPLPVLFGKYGFFKLGLRGGSPMWSAKPESSKNKTTNSLEEKPNTSSSIHKKTGISQSKINSLVCADYNDFDDDSRTPPQTPPTHIGESKAISSNSTSLHLGSPLEKIDSLPDTTDYDDDKTIVNTEVTLSSTAQRDNDDIPVIVDQFGDSDLDVITGTLEAGMSEEYVLFESDMVMSIDSNDSLSNALVNDNNEGHDLVQILEIEHPEPPNEDDLIGNELLSSHSSRNKKGLSLDLVRALPIGKRILAVTETPESPEEELCEESSPGVYINQSPDQELMASLGESDIVIIDSGHKSPEESTNKIVNDIRDKSDDESVEEIKEESKSVASFSSSDSNFIISSMSCTSNKIKTDDNIINATKSSINFNFNKLPSSKVSLPEATISSKFTSTFSPITPTRTLGKPASSGCSIIKELLVNTPVEKAKVEVTSKTLANIVADAKIAAKLSESTSKLKDDQVVEKTKKTDNVVITSNIDSKSTVILSDKLVTLMEVSSMDKLKNNSSQMLYIVQPTSVTLSNPKMSVLESPKNPNELPGKTFLKVSSINNTHQVENKIEKNSELLKEIKKISKVEKSSKDVIPNINNSISVQNIPKAEETNKTESLNTTDELESMLEAIHNPDDEQINPSGEKNNTEADKRTEQQVSCLKRMSPVTDNLSLVNILENDVDTVSQNEKQNFVEESKKPSNEKSAISKSESNKLFLPQKISQEKSVEEESSDDILDILQNIISSKPEMQDDNSKKSALLYQLEAPLEKPPLNILETPKTTKTELPNSEPSNVYQPSVDNKKILGSNKVTQQTSIVSKKPPASTSTPQNTMTIVVSSVAQLQNTTTTIPHLSPLSQPTEIKSNTENVSDQLRSLLSSLHSNFSSQSYTNTSQSNFVTVVTSAVEGSSVTTTSNNSQTLPNYRLQSISNSTTSTATASTASQVVTAVKETNQIPLVAIAGIQLHPTSTSQEITSSPITITSNAMLNAMLSNTTINSSIGLKSGTILTSSSLINSAMAQSSIQQRNSAMQALLSSGPNQPARLLVNVTASQPSSNNNTVMLSSRTIVPPVVTTLTNINIATSILQSTLSQAPSNLHTQLSSGQYKSSVLLPIDNKKMNVESEKMIVKKEKAVTSTESSNKISSVTSREDSQNVLLKQLLQNAAGSSAPSCPTTTSNSQTPNFPNVPSLEAQLAKPVPPTPPLLIPPLLDEISAAKPLPKQILSRETSFLSQNIKLQSTQNKEDPVKRTNITTSAPTVNVQNPTATQKVQVSALGAQQISLQVNQKQFPIIISSEKQEHSTFSATLVKPGVDTAKTNVTLQQQLVSTPVVIPRNLVQTDNTNKITTMDVQDKQLSQPLTQHHQIQASQITTVVQKPGVVASVATLPITSTNVLTEGPKSSERIINNQIQPIVPQQTIMVPQAIINNRQQAQILQHSTVPSHEIKKEMIIDDSSLTNNAASSVQLNNAKDFTPAKEESAEGSIDDKTDLKKIKRRQYQQKRRQSQGKDANMAPQKKRSRKVSRLDEDYDTFIDNLMIQLRQLQPMPVLEPLLGKNFGVCPVFGSGDLSKFGGPVEYNSRTGELLGTYGNARVNGVSDHYNTEPFGELEPLPPQPPASTQRGFYDQEFPPLKLDDLDEKKEIIGRDIDTPDTIVSSSSPECVMPEYMHKFSGLKLIEEESDEEAEWLKRISPVIPIISPIPIRLKPGHIKDINKVDKENIGVNSRQGKTSPAILPETGNITVTLTLSSQAADDIMGVLKDLANVLNIAPPTGYQIIERTTTPPSQKLGLYRIKGKDGKEGAPIDIQSILNGAAKFCRHCDVVILNSLIRKKVSEFPFLSKEEAESGDELYFCSVGCYKQFALMHIAPSSTHDKAATIVDHLCQKESKIIEEDLKKMQEKKFFMRQALGRMGSIDVNRYEYEMDPLIKSEKDELNLQFNANIIEEKKAKKHPSSDKISSDLMDQVPNKVWKGTKYKTWVNGCLQPPTKYKKPTDREITELLFRMGVTISIATNTEDVRQCMFCQNIGDGAADGPARLLNYDVDKWVHLNCALWSEDVYETTNGALMNLDVALQHGLASNCMLCQKPGATIKCFKLRCNSFYHLGCAVKDGCIFYKNKSTFCAQHVPKNEKDNELTTLAVYRRVYVNRDENKQVAAVMHHSDHNHLLRVGSLIFLSVGQLLPHQLHSFHTQNYIYPVGYKIVRFYWSWRRPNKRCRYICSIHDVSGRPEFRVLVQEPSQEDVELRDASPRAVWNRILEPLSELRRTHGNVQLFPRYVTGEDLFGLTEPAIVRVLESLPGVETLTDYRFKYGRNPLLELPLAINPTGCARTEARLKNQLPWKRPHTQRTGSSAKATFTPTTNTTPSDIVGPYSKQFVHSKSSQYKKMKMEWRNNVFLARSKIQGLGLYAARDLEKHTMVIEYIGEIIRTELAELREKQYEAKNRGIYMFRLDEDRVIDATLCGGLARYINHSCNPNCVTEIVEVERDLRIIIFAKRKILRGEELAYDYKFDIEDDQHKIACACGAPNCKKWMN